MNYFHSQTIRYDPNRWSKRKNPLRWYGDVQKKSTDVVVIQDKSICTNDVEVDQ